MEISGDKGGKKIIKNILKMWHIFESEMPGKFRMQMNRMLLQQETCDKNDQRNRDNRQNRCE